MTSTIDPKEPAVENGIVTDQAPDDTKPELTKDQRQIALSECYTEATKTLRERHRDEFNQLRVAAAKARGIEWTPQPTAAEKAAAEVEKLIADHPELAERFGIKTGEVSA